MKTQVKNLDRSKLNARFHQLLTSRSCDADEKMSIVNQVSNGQFTSAKELDNSQLLEAIKLLENDIDISIKKMRAKAINKAKELNILPDNITKSEDWNAFNKFCNNTFKKSFPRLNYNELRNCITGLENWQKQRQNKAIKELLS